MSVAISASFFFSWNNYNPVKLNIFNGQIDYYSIDSCSLTNNSLSVRGWAIYKKDPSIKVRIFAKKTNGEWVKVNYSVQSSPDVSKSFGENGVFDRSGFDGEIQNISAFGGLSGSIALSMTDAEGVVRGVYHDCK